MMITLLSSFLLGAPATPPPVTPPTGTPVALARHFALGEKLAYTVTASIRAQERHGLMDTFMPDNVDFSYSFTTEVRKLKTDGIVDLMYSRPTFTEEQDEDTDSGPVKKVDPVNMKALLTVSPINQILEAKDLTPKSKKSGDDRLAGREKVDSRQLDQFGDFINELHRLALFIGSFDSGMDFNPKLPLDKVSVGDTWKQTVSYQPQKIKGDKEGKQEVERLDYVYTYKGLMTSEGKQVQRVQASLEFSTDLGAFLNQLMEAKPEDSHIKKIPMNFKGTIDFDLDPKTLRTLRADAHSEGGFQIWITDLSDRPVEEQTFKGTTTETLVGVAKVLVPKS
jgi:hypothetical protein